MTKWKEIIMANRDSAGGHKMYKYKLSVKKEDTKQVLDIKTTLPMIKHTAMHVPVRQMNFFGFLH